MSKSVARVTVRIVSALGLMIATLLIPASLAKTASADDCGSGTCGGCVVEPIPTSVSIESTPPASDGLDGWFTTAPAVSVTAFGDPGTGVCDIPQPIQLTPRCVLDPVADPLPAAYADLPASCDLPATLADGLHTVYAGADGFTGQAFTSRVFEVDTLAPDVTCGTTSSFTLGGAGGSVSATVADTTSLPAATSVSAAADVTTPGVKSVDLTGSDNAGNQRTVPCPYVVGYGVRGFLSPIPHASYKRGSTIPVKFQLSDWSHPLSDAAAAAIANACDATITYSGGTPSPNCFRYSAVTHLFQFDLKVGKIPGTQTITATVKAGGQTVNTLGVQVLIK